MLITKVSSKIYKPKTYKKVIKNPIYDYQLTKTIEEELQNPENHQT